MRVDEIQEVPVFLDKFSICTTPIPVVSDQGDMPVVTLYTYYQVPEDTFVGYRIPSFSTEGRKCLLTTPVLFFMTTGCGNGLCAGTP